MAIIDDDDARIISNKIWNDIQFAVFSELDDRHCKIELQMLSGDKWGEKLNALCDWCFTNGIDCQTLYLMGHYCAQLYGMYKRNGSPVNTDVAAEGLPWSDIRGVLLTYLTMRQIAIKLHAPPPTKIMTLNEKIKSKYLSDPNKYVHWSAGDWATHFNVSRQAVEKTQVWKELIKPQQEKMKNERGQDLEDRLDETQMRGTRRKTKGADLYDPSDSDYG